MFINRNQNLQSFSPRVVAAAAGLVKFKNTDIEDSQAELFVRTSAIGDKDNTCFLTK